MLLVQRMGLSALIVLALGGGERAAPPSPDARVDIQVVKYPELSRMIAQHVGKVVVVDFWSVSCTPCRRKFSHLVDIHRKFAGQGLVALSVSLDEEAQRKEVQDEVRAFLKEQNATFTNLLLDEPYEVWRDKLDIAAPPCVFVFGRDGQWQKFDDDSLDADNSAGDTRIEKLVNEWLQR